MGQKKQYERGYSLRFCTKISNLQCYEVLYFRFMLLAWSVDWNKLQFINFRFVKIFCVIRRCLLKTRSLTRTHSFRGDLRSPRKTFLLYSRYFFPFKMNFYFIRFELQRRQMLSKTFREKSRKNGHFKVKTKMLSEKILLFFWSSPWGQYTNFTWISWMLQHFKSVKISKDYFCLLWWKMCW